MSGDGMSGSGLSEDGPSGEARRRGWFVPVAVALVVVVGMVLASALLAEPNYSAWTLRELVTAESVAREGAAGGNSERSAVEQEVRRRAAPSVASGLLELAGESGFPGRVVAVEFLQSHLAEGIAGPGRFYIPPALGAKIEAGLVGLVEEPNRRLRLAALAAVCELWQRRAGTPVPESVLRLMRELLESPEDNMLATYHATLGGPAFRALLPDLVAAFDRDVDGSMRAPLSVAIARVGGGHADVERVLVRGARDADEELREIALEELTRLGRVPPAALDAAFGAIDGAVDTDVERAALSLLARYSTEPGAAARVLGLVLDSRAIYGDADEWQATSVWLDDLGRIAATVAALPDVGTTVDELLDRAMAEVRTLSQGKAGTELARMAAGALIRVAAARGDDDLTAFMLPVVTGAIDAYAKGKLDAEVLYGTPLLRLCEVVVDVAERRPGTVDPSVVRSILERCRDHTPVYLRIWANRQLARLE